MCCRPMHIDLVCLGDSKLLAWSSLFTHYSQKSLSEPPNEQDLMSNRNEVSTWQKKRWSAYRTPRSMLHSRKFPWAQCQKSQCLGHGNLELRTDGPWLTGKSMIIDEVVPSQGEIIQCPWGTTWRCPKPLLTMHCCGVLILNLGPHRNV